MKKTSKIFGAAALTAALALGTAVPAFADTTTEGTVSGNTHHSSAAIQAGNANSTISMETQNTQIDVQVPLALKFYAQTAGGALGTPSAGKYFLANHSAADVYITKIVCDYATANAAGAVWGLTDGLDGTEVASKTDAGYIGDIAVDAAFTTEEGNAETVSLEVSMHNAGSSAKPNYQYTGPADIWSVDEGMDALKISKMASGTTDPTKFVIDFSGYNSILNPTSSTSAAEAVTLTYTVSVSPTITSTTDNISQA